MQLGSLMTNQPSLQPGTNHLLDKEPRVKIGVIELNNPIDIKGFSPNARCPYTSSAMINVFTFLAVSATWSSLKINQID